MPTRDRAALVEDVVALLRAFDAAQDLIDEAVTAAAGVDATELRALELVSRHGGLTAGALAAELGLTTGAVTGLVDRMNRAGYLEREDDPQDRRRVIIRLTAAGSAWERRTFGPLARAWRNRLSEYTPAQLAFLRDFLTTGRAIGEAHARALRLKPAGREGPPRPRRRSTRAAGS